MTDLVLKYGREHVYVYLTQVPLDIITRLVDAGTNYGVHNNYLKGVRMPTYNYKPIYNPVDMFITRFFLEDQLILEQETKVPFPSLDIGDSVRIYDVEHKVKKREFGFNEDAFFMIYYL